MKTQHPLSKSINRILKRRRSTDSLLAGKKRLVALLTALVVILTFLPLSIPIEKVAYFVITPALMMGMEDTVIDRIAFGGVKELEDLYAKH